MTDNGDNTYSYTFTPTRPTEHTIYALRYDGTGVTASYWADQTNIGGTPDVTKTITTPYEQFDSSTTPTTVGVSVATYNFLLVSPITGQINFLFNGVGTQAVYIDGPLLAEKGFSNAKIITVDVVAGQKYKFLIIWRGHLQSGSILTQWDLQLGAGYENIPEANLIPVTEIVPAITTDVGCPTGVVGIGLDSTGTVQ